MYVTQYPPLSLPCFVTDMRTLPCSVTDLVALVRVTVMAAHQTLAMALQRVRLAARLPSRSQLHTNWQPCEGRDV